MEVEEVWFVLLPEPLAWGFWVKVVRNDETSVVGWRSVPVPVEVDKTTEVTTTGLMLLPPPLAEEIALPDEAFDD